MNRLNNKLKPRRKPSSSKIWMLVLLLGLSLFIFGTLFILGTFNNPPIDEDISKDKELLELKVEIKRLREEVSVLSSNNRKSSNIKWEDISNWRKLKQGMSMDKVKQLLGEPKRVKGGSFTHWTYPDGKVTFYNEGLDSWSEPNF